MGKKPATRKIHRSAVTGRFVTERQVKRSPRTTTTEAVKKRGKK